VFVVSPTTLVATLTTMLAVIRDVRMRKEARAIQAEVERLLTDVARLSQRVGNLRRHHGNMADDMAEIEVSAGRVVAAGTRIRQVETGQDTPAHRPEG
jgi:DNA recombination protein RmuC